MVVLGLLAFQRSTGPQGGAARLLRPCCSGGGRAVGAGGTKLGGGDMNVRVCGDRPGATLTQSTGTHPTLSRKGMEEGSEGDGEREVVVGNVVGGR